MEGGRERDHVTGAAPRSSGDESSGIELSLRLTTGSGSPPPPPPPAAAAAEQQEAAARRSMTIFYNGRVCAVVVTDIQAREIISMANQQLRRDEGHLQDRAAGAGATARRGVQVMRPAAAASPAGCQRQGLATTAAPAPAPTDQAGLSMKRSLQMFLQKREARRAAAVAPPYAGGGRQAQAMRH